RRTARTRTVPCTGRRARHPGRRSPAETPRRPPEHRLLHPGAAAELLATLLAAPPVDPPRDRQQALRTWPPSARSPSSVPPLLGPPSLARGRWPGARRAARPRVPG